MQKTIKKRFDFIKIIINIVMLILMILSIVLKDNDYYSFYWMMVSVMLMYEVMYVYKWSKIGEWNIDKYESKTIRRMFDGLTTGTVVITAFIYLTVMALEMFEKSIKTNNYVIILVYILFTISILCNYLAISTAGKETKELAEKTFKYKK